MAMNPSFVLIIAAVLGIAVAFTLMVVSVLWARVGSLPVEETTRIVDDLTRRQQSIEALLVRLEVIRDPDPPTGLPTLSIDLNGSKVRSGAVARADRPAATAVSGPTLIAIPSLTAASAEASAEAVAELGRRFEAIWSLAEAGESPEAIARKTSQPIGQVELILGLRRQLLAQAVGKP